MQGFREGAPGKEPHPEAECRRRRQVAAGSSGKVETNGAECSGGQWHSQRGWFVSIATRRGSTDRIKSRTACTLRAMPAGV